MTLIGAANVSPRCPPRDIAFQASPARQASLPHPRRQKRPQKQVHPPERAQRFPRRNLQSAAGHQKSDDYLRLLEKYKMGYAEVSDGSIDMDHDEKCKYITALSKHVTVLSEVGSKDENKMLAPYKWIELMKKEIEAGSYKVIAEARESGTVGIYQSKGEVRSDLIDEILTQVPQEKILWEAPLKAQQVYFIKLLGSNVNLGNIPPNEVIPLETLRLGLRGDTFHHFLK